MTVKISLILALATLLLGGFAAPSLAECGEKECPKEKQCKKSKNKKTKAKETTKGDDVSKDDDSKVEPDNKEK